MLTYRQLHEEQLRQNRPGMYRDLRRHGELKEYLDGIAQEACEMHARVVRQLAERHPYDPTAWHRGQEAWEAWLNRTARDLVLHDLILVPDQDTERAMRDGYTD